MNSAATRDEAVSLSPEEQREVEKSAGLITQGQAVEAVKRWVKIPDNMELRSAGLEKAWNNPGLGDKGTGLLTPSWEGVNNPVPLSPN